MNRPLGFGLIALGAVLGGVMLIWLLVTLLGGQTSPGGAVLGLLLAAVLGLPLIGGGLYVLSRGQQEAAEAAEFRTQRRTLGSDRLFRAEQARELEQLARRVEAAGGPPAVQLAARLRDLVRDLEAPGYDQAAWYEAVELGRADQDALGRYDDLLTDGVRQLGELVARLENGEAVLPELRQAVQTWERSFALRSDLLRGRRAPSVAPTDLLRAGPPAPSREALATLGLGDAVSRDGADYLVETSVSYFAGGRTWWLYRLESGRDEAWLYVGPGALSLAWLTPTDAPAEPGSPNLEHDGTACQLEESATAAASVQTRGGPQAGGTVTTWRYTCADGQQLLLERWPDGARAYGGRPIKPSDLEIWPAQVGRGP